MHIGRETHAPRRIQIQRTSIAELPGVKVARLLQQVTRVVVAARTVERHLIPVLAHAQLQTFRNAAGVGGVTLRRGIPLQRHIAHIVVVVVVGGRRDVPHSGRVDSLVIGDAGRGVPVAVDILRLCDTPARQRIVGHHIRYRVERGAPRGIGIDEPCMTLYEVVETQVETMGERGLQSWVTLRHIQRVRVVGDVQQVAHRRLTAAAAVFQAQLLLPVPPVAEGHGGRYVQHVAHGIGIMPIVTLHEMGALRLHQHTNVQLVFLLNDAQRHAQVVDIVLIFRETAQRLTLIIVHRMP